MTRDRPAALLDPTRSALVVIDIQNDFCHPQGRAGRGGRDLSMMTGMLTRARALIDAARETGVLLVHVQHTVLAGRRSDADAWSYFISPLAPDGSIVVEGTWGHDFMEEVRPGDGELVLPKHRSSAFYSTRLEVLLRANGISTVALCGVLAEGCVESTLRDAFHRDYYPLLVPDATASYSRDLHDAYVTVASARHDAICVADVVAGWRRHVHEGALGVQREGALAAQRRSA